MLIAPHSLSGAAVLEPGLEGTVERSVSEDMTATALGSGDIPVLGTPAVLAMMEAAACRAIDGRLAASETSVGSTVDIEHLAPTPLAAPVIATAKLVDVDDRKLTFQVRVTDPGGEVARGVHHRVVVERARFEETARGRLQPRLG